MLGFYRLDGIDANVAASSRISVEPSSQLAKELGAITREASISSQRCIKSSTGVLLL
jgi:hypothetical protein